MSDDDAEPGTVATNRRLDRELIDEGRPMTRSPGLLPEPKCNHPGCNRTVAAGEKYCLKHRPTPRTGIGPKPSPPPIRQSSPSRRELQRQLDQIEGKLDAIVAALDLEVDD